MNHVFKSSTCRMNYDHSLGVFHSTMVLEKDDYFAHVNFNLKNNDTMATFQYGNQNFNMPLTLKLIMNQ